MHRRELLLSGAALAAVAALPARHANAAAPSGVDDFFTRFTADWVRADASLATSLRYFEGSQQDALERQITPVTRDWSLERIRRARRGLAQLRGFDRAAMSDVQRASTEVLAWHLDTIARREPFLDYSLPIEQFGGVNVQLVEVLTVRHPLGTARDAENYVAALGQVATRMNEAIADAQRLQRRGVLPPQFIVTATLAQLQRFIAVAPAESPFVTTLATRMSAIKDLTGTQRTQLAERAQRIVARQVYPAWQRAIALIESQGASATDDAGLWRFQNGAEIYSYALARFTTTAMSAQEIHEIGREQVARYEGEMHRLLGELGRSEGPVQQRIEQLRVDLRYPQPTAEASREQIMRDIDDIIRDAERRAAPLFGSKPKAPLVAQPFPSFREGNAAASYNMPASDGSRPGTFQFPRRIEMMTRFGLRSIVYHEGVPGHHFQLALEMESTELPRFRKLLVFGAISAYNEGWALYAERLAGEEGWYEGDATGRLGQLNYALFRARRLVVDTGLHAMKWTRQQAIDYGIEASEIERYVVNPGQACSYMVGELRIVALRERMKARLGSAFSLPAFHDAVLRVGTGPLSVLESELDRVRA